MANLITVFALSVSRRASEEILRAAVKHNQSCTRLFQTSAVKIGESSLLFRRNKESVSSLKKVNVRFQSQEKKSDRFIPKDPLENKSLWKSFILVTFCGSIILVIMLNERHNRVMLMENERQKSLGKAAIGGKFELVDHNNQVRKSEDFHGQWLLIYFGFTHCPDICPDELEKLVEVLNIIDKTKNFPKITPLFITVDPERDTPEVVGKYIKEFSDKFIGLTGTVEQIKQVCKAYRVYFSPGPKDRDSDYIVDHSIITYLIDPDGNFTDYYARNSTAESIVESIKFNVLKLRQLKKPRILDIFS